MEGDFSCLVASGRHATELLEAVEHPLNAVSVLVGPVVLGGRVLPACLRQKYRPDPVDQELFTQEITVVAFASKGQPLLADRYRQQVRNGVVV